MSLTWERKSHPSPGSADCHRQDKPKKDPTETQVIKLTKIKDKEKNLKSS